MNESAESLQGRYRRCLDVPLGLLASAGLLGAGLLNPMMRVEKMLFWEDHYSILSGGLAMLRERNYVLAVVLLGFSVLFPIVKLGAMCAAWFVPTTPRGRRAVLAFTSGLGKWSMLDVFVVALLVVLSQSKKLMDVQPEIGLYFFAGSVVLAMLVSARIEALARRASGQEP